MEIVNKMDRMAREWELREDKRAIFLRCYCMMTRNMVTALGDKRFIDQDWVGDMLNRFAEYYFDALACFDCGEEVPMVWRYVHDAAEHKDLHVLQHLFLGVNAHINYDLVLTLYELLQPEWDQLSEDNRRNRHLDHQQVNTIIEETIDRVQDEVVEQYNPRMDLVDKMMGRLDERLIGGLIRKWRKSVWNNTLLLLETKNEEEVKAHIQQIEKSVLQTAKWLVFL